MDVTIERWMKQVAVALGLPEGYEIRVRDVMIDQRETMVKVVVSEVQIVLPRSDAPAPPDDG